MDLCLRVPPIEVYRSAVRCTVYSIEYNDSFNQMHITKVYRKSVEDFSTVVNVNNVLLFLFSSFTFINKSMLVQAYAIEVLSILFGVLSTVFLLRRLF